MNLYLIDGNSYVYRAYFAIKGLRDSKGRPTNAIYGFTTMLLKIIKEKRPDGLVVSFDHPAPTERHILYEEYKAHRPESPDELRQQIPHIKKVIEALRIKIFEIPGYEADDILATLAEKASQTGMDAYIVTGDKDMLQLVHDHIKVYDPMKDAVLDEGYVIERFGVPPKRVPEFMALTGDAADNIPGVKGIGEKTAKELLSGFESLDELMAHTERIKKERLRKLIEENTEVIKLSRRLAEINRDVPVEFAAEESHIKEPDWQALLGLFKEFEFTTLTRLIPAPAAPEIKCEIITEAEKLREFLSAAKGFSLDLEPQEGQDIKGIGICTKDNAVYIPLNLERDALLDAIRPSMEDENRDKTGHDLKKAILRLKKEGIALRGRLYDIMVASYLLNPLRADHTLENICLEQTGRRWHGHSAYRPSAKGHEPLPPDEAGRYSCGNAGLCLELGEVLFEKLKEAGLEHVYFDIETPLIYVLSEMEDAGVKIDVKGLKALSHELETGLDTLRQRIYFLAGEEFNINSPKQLGRILFDVLGLKPIKRKKTGYSTEMGVLEELSKAHELPAEVLTWRSLFKLKTTYADVLPGLVDPGGRLHTSFNQTATATGRLSSSDPNLQNIPIRGRWGRRIREAFTAEPGNILITADYSQIELRILAHLSGDPGLREAFMKEIDIHSRTASELFGVAPSAVTPEMRRIAKSVNFGIVYGVTPFGLSETLGISKEEAGRIIENYFQRHPLVKSFIEQTIKEAREKGHVRTLSGRMRPLPELKSRDATQRALGERLAVNAPMQGTAADIIKIAMINISHKLKGAVPPATFGAAPRILIQVHDELLLECPEGQKEEMTALVREEMEGAMRLSVPLRVEVGSGRNWVEASH